MKPPPFDDLLMCLRRLQAVELPDRPSLRLLISLLHRELAEPGSIATEPLLTATSKVGAACELGAPCALLGDRRIHRACALIHGDLAKGWTVTSLARAVGLSRATFARRFAEATGLSPKRYLAHCRMEHAAMRLHASEASLSEIAQDVGYESEFAFNRAFKRHHGLSPGVFRKTWRPVALSPVTARAA